MNWATGVCLFFSLMAVIATLRVWKRNLRWISKLKFGLVALACVLLSWFSVFYHVIGPAHRL